MNAPGKVEIRRLSADMLDDVVAIHRAGMGYSLNAQLGADHLRYLYGVMSSDPSCYIGVAFAESRVTGVVSGCIDADSFTSRVMKEMPAGRLLQTVARMLLRPKMIWLWFQGNSIARPVRIGAHEVRAVLTAIVVDPRIQGRGIGRGLVAAFEAFLREAGIPSYRLDTRISNHRAAEFYRSLGFVEVCRRADSLVFVRNLPA